MRLLLLGCLGLWLAGCTVEGLSGPGRTTTLGYDLTLLKPRALAAVPLLPIHLAVAQAGATVPDTVLLEALRAQPRLFREVSPLPAADAVRPFAGEVDAHDPEELLLLAEGMGAEALLLVGGAIESESARTAASVLDLTILGNYVVPSNRIQGKGRAIGVLISVRERRPLETVDAAVAEVIRRPSNQRHSAEKALVGALREDLLREIAKRFIEAFGERAGRAPAAPSAKTKRPTPRRGPKRPVATVYLLSDGFHVSLALPVAPGAETPEYLEVGLGERSWVMDRSYRWLSGAMAALVQNEGAAVVERLAGGTEALKTKKRVWPIALTAEEWGRMIGALEEELRLQEVLLDGGAAYKVVSTASGYHLFHTCHHFALNPLGHTGREIGAGFPKPTPLLERQIDRRLK